ncbi:MAG: phosphoglucosamine mutase [Armatimonadetes bacterium]|nr:phosphoglucosamine mutase [Armatimonadota bacterium]
MHPLQSLKISISGVRGIVGEALTPLLLARFAQAFGGWCGGGGVVLGRDTRRSGEMACQAVVAGLLAAGCRVLDAGIVPTPTVQYNVPRRGAAGGVIVTASHNPEEWNALKLVGPDGLFLSPLQAEELLDIYHQEDPPAAEQPARHVAPLPDAVARHLQGVLARVDVAAVRRRGFRVAVDAVNGAGSVMNPLLCEALGCELVPLHMHAGGGFPREPEPLPEHLGELCDLVRSSGADLGFAQDPDADRLALVDEGGVCLGGEYALAVACRHVLERCGGGRVVVNLSTSRAVDDAAGLAGGTVRRSKIGEINVVLDMRRQGAVIGGEGNGGVIDPALHYARDSFAGMALILEHLALHGRTVTEALAGIGRYVMARAKLPRPPLREVGRMVAAVRQAYAGRGDATVDTRDGVRVDLPAGWVHLRASNTEPILRIVAEAAELATAERLIAEVRATAGV